MAQNPGNKIKKDTNGISAEEKRYLDALRKAKDDESNAIREFKQAQQDELSKIIQDSHRVEQYIKNNTDRIKEATDKGLDTSKLNAQLEQNQQRLKQLNTKRRNLTDRLEAAGREDIIAAAESQAIDEEMVAEYQRRANKVSALNKEYKRAVKSGKSDAELDDIKKKLNAAEAEAKDPQILNKGNFGGQQPQKQYWLKNLPGGFNKYTGDMNDARSAWNKSPLDHSGNDIFKELRTKIPNAAGKIIDTLGKILDVAGAIRKPLDQFVDGAADVLAANVGRINAALEGTGRTYASTTESMVESLGMNRFVQQTDYIQNIARLTADGVTFNVEQRAILETIKDKAITSFSSMDAHLLRLIRLKQTDVTASQFGMEAALRNTLNRVFKDSTYMKDMFDGIAGAITDAVLISGGKDVTEYSSVVQTWMGAMYESGIDSGMVNKMAGAINALGSGNVSALASDQDIQRLVLLSMDSIGMDYADILQQGLSASDVNDLLTAIVKYLSKIESNTKDNNVLQSSYTNLFGMSMADLQGFKNLQAQMGKLTSVNQGTAMAVTKAEVDAIETTARTIVAEQVNNAFANARFTFGNSIAKDGSSYLQWKISNMTLDLVEQYLAGPGGKGFVGSSLAKITGRAAQALIFKNELKGLFSMFESLPSLFNNENTGISHLLNFSSGPSSYGAETGATGGSIGAAVADTVGGAFKAIGNLWSRITSHEAYVTSYERYSGEEWEKDEDQQDEIIGLLESAMVMHNAENNKKAFATYLVGMTDDTLRSFASIFADEDAMADTFEGENNVLKDNLFKYAGDETSNSADSNSSGSGTNTTSTTTPTKTT